MMHAWGDRLRVFCDVYSVMAGSTRECWDYDTLYFQRIGDA